MCAGGGRTTETKTDKIYRSLSLWTVHSLSPRPTLRSLSLSLSRPRLARGLNHGRSPWPDY